MKPQLRYLKAHFYIGFILLFSICLSSCSDDDDTISNSADNYPATITPTLIVKGELDGDGAENIPEQNLVLQNTADWQALIAKMNTVNTESNNFSETEIDFENYQIIASFTDVKRSGSTVKIDSIIEYEDQIKVFVGDPVIGGLSVISQPYYIVKIPVSTKPVYFK